MPGSVCVSSQEALWVAEELSTRIESLKATLDHRSIFSPGYNRNLAKRIELMERIREAYMKQSRDFYLAAREDKNAR